MLRFHEVKKEFMKFPTVPTVLPTRADKGSAGYDFRSKEFCTLKPNEIHMFWTDVCAEMPENVVLHIYTRSGNGCKHGIILRNNVGVVDSSYFNNEQNGGIIGIGLVNTGAEDFVVNVGDRIAQGVFIHYLACDEEEITESKRNGGFGSSGK